MTEDSFDYLTCVARVSTDAPESWMGEHHLPFWEDPNDPRWGQRMGRVLYHEAVHFWQLLASGYLANLVAEDWVRMVEFEATGDVSPVSEAALAYGRAGDQAFSALELVECWARFWDVHTRNPDDVMADMGLEPVPAPAANGSGYHGHSFDTYMREGRDAVNYARPYRFLLETFDGASVKAQLFFPAVVHAAFGSPSPVEFFCAAAESARSGRVWDNVRPFGSINLDWLTQWDLLRNDLVLPLLERMQLPDYTSGLDVVDRGVLSEHPILREYPTKATLKGWSRMYRPIVDDRHPGSAAEEEALLDKLRQDPGIAFALPGQPFYRRALGELVPPPTVLFGNFSWHAHRPISLVLSEQKHQGEQAMADLEAGRRPVTEDVPDTYEQASSNLEARVTRFRNAEWARDNGLTLAEFS